MKTSAHETESPPQGGVPGTTTVPLCVVTETAYAQETLARLPLAESVLLLWQQVADAAFLQGLFDQHRGRCYDKVLSFPNLVQLIADALLHYDGSARASFEHALQDDALAVTIPAAYGKWRRLPIALIHEPGEAVSFDGLLPGASFEDAFDLGAHGLEVAEAGPQRRLQVG